MYVYILFSKTLNVFYKGLTNNLNRRFEEHNKSKCSVTKHGVPWELVYVHECDNYKDGRDWEKLFKSGTGREVIKELIKCGCGGTVYTLA